ncbi:hypothetical protein, partial [Streptomyces lonarensis]|uniref:hypothetical protein n=1 Tax=Streptomyces lonarensis TaxID=700599 RepID=UPI0030C68C1F
VEGAPVWLKAHDATGQNGVIRLTGNAGDLTSILLKRGGSSGIPGDVPHASRWVSATTGNDHRLALPIGCIVGLPYVT